MKLYLDQMLDRGVATALRDRGHDVIRVAVHPTLTENVLGVLLPFVGTHDAEELQNRLAILSKAGQRWIKTAPDQG